MLHHAITYHEEDKAAASFDVEAMGMPGKQSFSFLGFVIQQEGNAGSGDAPVLCCVLSHRHHPSRDKFQRNTETKEKKKKGL